MKSSRDRARIDLGVRREPVGDQRDAVQRHPLVGHHRRTLLRPVRLGVRLLRQVAGELLGPLRLDGRVLPGPEPAGLHELAGHQELRRLLGQPAAGEDREPARRGRRGTPASAVARPVRRSSLSTSRAPRAAPMWLSSPDSSAWWIPSASAASAMSAGPADLDAHLLADLTELGLEVLPLADPQVVEELALAHPPERAAAELLLLLLEVPPEVEPGEEVAGLVLEPRVQLVGVRAVLLGPLPRVLQRQCGRDDDHLADAAQPFGLDDHPGQPRVDREPGEPTSDLGEPHRAGRGRPSSSSSWTPDWTLRLSGGSTNGKRRDVAEAEAGHLQDDAGQVGAQDLRLGELGTALEVLLGVEPDRDAGLEPAAAAGPLVGGGLADRLDGQPLHLGPHRVAADPGDAGVDDVPDAGHGQRRLGHVGGQHDPASGVRRRRPGAARPPRAGSRAGRSRSAGGRRARPRCPGSPARRAGTPGCRPAPRRTAP